MVTAVKKGGTLTAQVVADVDSLRDHGPFGFKGPGGMGGMGFGWRGHGPGDRSGDGDTSTSTATAPTTEG